MIATKIRRSNLIKRLSVLRGKCWESAWSVAANNSVLSMDVLQIHSTLETFLGCSRVDQ